MLISDIPFDFICKNLTDRQSDFMVMKYNIMNDRESGMKVKQIAEKHHITEIATYKILATIK